MSVYKLHRTNGFTVMSNFHLRDKNLSLKSVGLLSKMLSFPDGWKFSTRGLASICKEGPDAITTALKELEQCGYLVRTRQRDSLGRLSQTEFDLYEQPRERPDTDSPCTDHPDTENPDMDKPYLENPCQENPLQINTNQEINQKRKNDLNNNLSINLDRMDRIELRERYKKLIWDNLEVDILRQDNRFDSERVDEIVEIMLDAICSAHPTIHINGEDIPQEVVKSRLLKLNSLHIEYVFDSMKDNPSDIRNIRAYLLTTLYNAPNTMGNYYAARVNHDFYG